MWPEIAQGGVGLIGLGVGFKLLWPLLSKIVEASTSRSETDTTIHKLYQETVSANNAMSIKLGEQAAANAEMSAKLTRALEKIETLQKQVDELTRDLQNARMHVAKPASAVGGA